MDRSGASPRKLTSLPLIALAATEAAHFLSCRTCGQAIDLRNLGKGLHHEEPGHAPLPTVNSPTAVFATATES